MKIKINYSKTKELRRLLWSPPELGWGNEFHRSDMILCPLRGYYRLTGIPPKPPEKLVAYGIVGTTLHNIIESKFPNAERDIQWCNIHNTIDVVWDKYTEIKTTRMSILNPSDIPRVYKEQILSGMVATKEFSWYLITLDIVNMNLLVWDVIAKSKEVNDFKYELLARRDCLSAAVLSRNPTWLTPHLNECGLCPYKYTCRVWTNR